MSRHEERCSEAQVMSDDESEAQRGDEEEEGSAARSARDPGSPTADIAKRAVSHWPYCSWRVRIRELRRTRPVIADCVAGGEMAANESLVLVMVDTETSVVFAPRMQ